MRGGVIRSWEGTTAHSNAQSALPEGQQPCLTAAWGIFLLSTLLWIPSGCLSWDWKASVRYRQGNSSAGITLKSRSQCQLRYKKIHKSNGQGERSEVRSRPEGFEIREPAMQTIAWNKNLLGLKQGQNQLISPRKQCNKRLDPATRTIEAGEHW